MKKLVSFILIMVLLFTIATAVTAEDESVTDKVVRDSSIFFQTPVIVCECMDSDYLCLQHQWKDNITFFKWTKNGEEKMPAFNKNTCLGGSHHAVEAVVFLDGVPNLVDDLFKAWEGTTQDVYLPDSVKEIEENCFVKGSAITLHFTKNNPVALAYAQNRGMAFEVMDAEERLPGDVNFDQSADMKDVLTLRQFIARIPTAYEIGSTDVNGDESTDMKDVLALRRQIAEVK